MLAPWPIGDKRTCRSDLCNNARRLVWIAIDARFQLPSCASGWGVVSSDEQSLDMGQQEMQNGR